MTSSKDFLRQIYLEDDGSKIARPDKVKLGGKTEVELDPQVSPPHPSDNKPEGRDPSTITGRDEKIDFPKQDGPANPASHLGKMWADSLEQQTRRAQQRQSGKYRDQ